MTPIALEELLTPYEEGRFRHLRTGELMIQDRLGALQARREVRRRLAEGDVTLLASPGQLWTLRPEFDSLGDWPRGRTLELVERRTSPPAALVADEAGQEREIRLTVLAEMYELTAWRWTE
ncbi:hypothetical protein F7Q99_38580 [Streptomyces kaniharaensis]|uniref:Uncharacterized protein n=1 Tax=Streptomyces kaniharaensis TaxID=212423 RepID=A0A6N7L6U2_9ACTN|nr:hypothetical protein [Streptomyces kaniharaensis]MQS17943.1 hypothetical protein [Streptomyces kaniharaensis]